MPESKHRRKGRNRPRPPERMHHVLIGEHDDDCPTCQALARGDENAALRLMMAIPEPESDRHVLVGHDDGTLTLQAHGQEWVTTEAEFFADPLRPCPECDRDL